MANFRTCVRWIVPAMSLLFCCITPGRLAAQGTTAAVLGTVSDASGGSIPDASVVVTNVGTGIMQSATTDAQGRYSVPNLEIGDYQVEVSKDGFTTVVRKGITLTVGSQTVVDFSLPVGTQTQKVTVEAQVVQVETTTSTLSSLIDPKQMRDLPLNGRSFEQLILLSPGVSGVNTASINAKQGNFSAQNYGGAGARTEAQAILFDDEDLNGVFKRGIGTITGSSLGVEAMAEFSVLTNTYGAQFGGNGIVINAASKSGTNGFHGSVYEFLRNSALDARNFFDKATIPPFRKNQFGGSLGGPVKKEKMFFFVNYEGIRQTLGQTMIATVPDANHRTPTATNPATIAAIQSTLALYPLPTFNFNAASGTGQATEVASQIAQENYGLARLDYNISAKDSIFLRYMVDRQFLLSPFNSSAIPLWPEQDNGHSDFFTTEWKRILSNSIINTARFSFSSPTGVTLAQPSGAPSTPALQFFPASSGRTVGTVSISGLTGLGLTTFVPEKQVQNRFTGAEDLLWTRGAHNLRFGASVARLDTNVFFPFRNGTTWTFTSLTNFLAGNASTLNGTPLGPQFYPSRQYREIDFAFYAQDDWKATSKLTLNLGLRYEPQTNPVDAHNALFTLVNHATATGFTNVKHITQVNPHWWSLDPRLGFAYDLFADHKTAIRGGFAIVHSPMYPGNYTGAFSSAPPWNIFQQTNAIYPLVTGLAASLPTASPGWNWLNRRDPYMIMYNLNIQREFLGSVLSVGYVGSRGVHLETALEQNPPAVTVDANGVLHFAQIVAGKLVANPRLNPNLSVFTLSTDNATSRYNALQATLNRRFNSIWQFQVAYTYSRCIDDGNNYIGLNYNGGAGTYENPYDPKADKGLCSFDITHNLRVNSLIALPLHGNRFIEGWQISPIVSVASGPPFSVTDGFDQVGYTASGTPRPNVVAGCDPKMHTVQHWFNPACFSLQTAGTLGNAGRDILRGPDLRDVDFAFTKDTKISEAFRVQFRAEIFNILNRANFYGPSAGTFTAGTVAGTGNPDPNAGQITRTITTSRQIQFGLKLLF